MTKNILIPTDYSLESLIVLKEVLKEKVSLNSNINYQIHFVTGYYRGDSIRDLLFNSEERILEKIKSQEFDEACAILQNKYSELINGISHCLYSGYFQSGFNHFLEINEIDEIYFSNTKLRHSDSNVFDLSRFIKKSNVSTSIIETETTTYPQSRGLLAQFFT